MAFLRIGERFDKTTINWDSGSFFVITRSFFLASM